MDATEPENVGSAGHAPQGRTSQNKPASWVSGEQKAITSTLDAPELDYVQSPRLLGHGELFRDRVFTQSDWDAHISFRRYLPEPVVMCVHQRYLFCPYDLHAQCGGLY